MFPRPVFVFTTVQLNHLFRHMTHECSDYIKGTYGPTDENVALDLATVCYDLNHPLTFNGLIYFLIIY